MQSEKDRILRRIRARARRQAEYLAGEFARAAFGDREAILAALEYEHWFADACDDVL